MPDLNVVPGAQAKPKGRWVPWEGGRFWFAPDGTRTYYIRRWLKSSDPKVSPKRVEIRTTATTEKAAHEQLKRFEADPSAYDPVGSLKGAPVYLDLPRSEDFLKWSLLPRKDGGAGNTAKWVGQQRLYVAWWAKKLAGLDLRKATLGDHIMPALKGATCRPQRIAVIKRVYSWLRKVEHKLVSREDPTMNDLPVPQYEPAQRKKIKARPKKDITKVMKHLNDRHRDLLVLLAASGMHATELERFARDGSVEPLPPELKRNKKLGGLLVIPKTKSGGDHRVAVSKPTLAVAKRVLKAGPFDGVKLLKAMKAASEKAGIPKLTPGVLRHSVATAARMKGATVEDIAEFLHHADPRTTERWYIANGVAKKIPTMD